MKKFINIIFKISLLVCLLLVSTNYSIALDYENGHFEKIDTNLSIGGCPLTLKDGRVLILGINENFIFDPKTNKFKETQPTPFGFSYISNGKIFPATVLNDGTVFIIGNILDQPSQKFQAELYHPIKDLLLRNELQNNYSILSMSTEKRNSVIYTRYKEYRRMPEEQKNKIYMPIIKNNPELLAQYTKYCTQREKSRYALLFDPQNETFEFLDKLDPSYQYTSGLIPIVKSDNEILIFDLNGEIQLYNLAKHSLNKLQSSQNFNIKNIIPMSNKTYLLLLYGSKYTLYDIKTNKYTNIEEFPFPERKMSEIVKLNNSELVLLGNTASQGVYVYNLMNKELKHITNFLFRRYLNNDLPLRPIIVSNKQMLIFGGYKDEYGPGLFNTSHQISNKAELINLLIGKSKLKNMQYIHAGSRSVLLNDGRILIYGGNNNELYVPNGYKDKE